MVYDSLGLSCKRRLWPQGQRRRLQDIDAIMLYFVVLYVFCNITLLTELHANLSAKSET